MPSATFTAFANFSKVRSEARTASDALRGVKSAAQSVNDWNNASSLSKLSAIGTSAAKLGRTMSIGVTLPIVAVGVAATKTFVDFDSLITQAGLKAGATSTELAQMRDVAIDMGAKTIFSATEAAGGMDQLAAAGFNARDAIVALPGVMLAAQAANEDLGLTAKIVATSMNAFNLEADQSAHVADVMAQAANTSAIDMLRLGEALGQAGQLGASANQSLEDVVASVSMLVNQGVPAASAGAAVRQAISSLQAPTQKAAIFLEDLGIKVRDAGGNMLPLPDIIRNLQNGLDESNPKMKLWADTAKISGKEARDQALNIFFGIEGMKAMTLLMGESSTVTLDLAKDTEKLNQMQIGLNKTIGVDAAAAFIAAHTANGQFVASGGDAVQAMSAMNKGADGVAAKFGEAFSHTLGAQLDQMKGSLESLAIVVVGTVLPAFTSMVGGLTGFFTQVAEFSKANPQVAQFVVGLLAVLAVVGPLLVGVGFLAQAVSSIAGLFVVAAGAEMSIAGATWAWTAALLANPVTWIVIAIIALIAALILLWQNWDTVVAWVTAVWGAFVTWLSQTWDAIVAAVQGFGASVMAFLQGIWDGIVATAMAVWNGIVAFFQGVLDNLFFVIIGPLGLLALWIAANWDRISAKAVEIWTAIVTFIAGIPARIMAGLAWLASLPGIVGAWFQSVWQAILKWLNDAVAFVKSIPSRILDGLIALAQLGVRAAEWFRGMYDAGVQKLTELVNWVKGIPGRIMTALGDLGNLLVRSGKALVDGFLDGIKSAWNALVSWVERGMDKLRDLWPFSPAKAGPFSGRGYVTYSGEAMTDDFAASLAQGAGKVGAGAVTMLTAASDVLKGGFSPDLSATVALTPSQLALSAVGIDGRVEPAAAMPATDSTAGGTHYHLHADGWEIGMDSDLEDAVREIVDAVGDRRRFDRTDSGQ